MFIKQTYYDIGKLKMRKSSRTCNIIHKYTNSIVPTIAYVSISIYNVAYATRNRIKYILEEDLSIFTDLHNIGKILQ